MYKIKIFTGLTAYNVEDDFNRWSDEIHDTGNNIEIKEFVYKVNKSKGYSVAVLYTER